VSEDLPGDVFDPLSSAADGEPVGSTTRADGRGFACEVEGIEGGVPGTGVREPEPAGVTAPA
jgi:hypothetical protein